MSAQPAVPERETAPDADARGAGGSAAPVVVARSVGRRFRSVVAVEGVSIEVSAGEIFGVVGADGSGKTTLLQMLAAILDPTAGRCEVLGFDTVRQSEEVTARIGYMSQGFTLYERLTVAENLTFAAAVRDVEPLEREARRKRLLAMAGLDRFTGRRAGALSGGMKKKLALCTNLIHEPRVLLLDEPSLGVDPRSRRELWTLLEDFRSRGAAIMLSTSYMDEAGRCDRVLFLHEGRVLAVGSPRDLTARVAGSVFEVDTADPAGVERRLASIPGVRGIARRPRKVRFLLEESAQGGDARATGLRQLPGARAATPQLEDLFASAASATTESAADGGAALPVPGEEIAGVATGPTVRVRGVTCRFGSFIAVNDVSLELAPGEVFGFLGPNGAGKTTFIRVLCGLQPFQAGSVEVAGVDVGRDAKSLRRHIGYMSQRFSLYPDLTVMENLEFFAGVYGLDAPARSAAIIWAQATAGLGGLDDRRVSAISGAVRQRLALACSVMHRPRVLFLDEPTSGVDPLSRHRFWRLVQDLAHSGVTIFVTTHYMEEASYCERLGLMLDGRLMAVGSLEELRSREQLPADASVETLFLHYTERAPAAA